MPLLPSDLEPNHKVSTVVLQYVVKQDFELDLAMLSDSVHSTPLTPPQLQEAHKAASAEQLSAELERRIGTFDRTFEQRFGATVQGEMLPFARYAFSALIGGTGYFYGNSLEKLPNHHKTGGTRVGPTVALFSAVPCRPFFPRGFMWDEGFHQLLVAGWDSAITRDVLSHWFGLMRPNGWIPREQILGVEAVKRVPQEFIAQSESHANPPTLLLVVEKLMRDEPEAHDAFFKEMFPALRQWFEWFNTTQHGELPNTYRWRGRDPMDGKLNAMTLSSGLDDYPRSSQPSKEERHVDLLCWMAKAAAVLQKLATRIGEVELAKHYERVVGELSQSILSSHWSPRTQAFHDFGVHDNAGTFKKLPVVRCNNHDEQGVDAMVDPQMGDVQTQCPPSHPIFKWPLGDGQGAIMHREKYVSTKEKPRFVEHVGYISIFPLMLRLLPVDAPELEATLKTMRDPEQLWTPWGLRSISKRSTFYQKENAPGDAPYWRGPIWINLQYLALYGLHYYANQPGPYSGQAQEIYTALRSNIMTNLHKNWERTNFLWEQYSDKTGHGQRARPFNGWSSLVVAIMGEDF